MKKKRENIKDIQVERHYSGDASRDFWRIVNFLPSKIDVAELYSLGVALQNLEEFVLKRLHDVSPNGVKQ